MMCISSSQGSTVQRFFNDGKSSSIQTNPTLGLSNIAVTNNNGVLSCQFQRTKCIGSSDGRYYDLSKSYYILLAKGSLSGSKNSNQQKNLCYSC